MFMVIKPAETGQTEFKPGSVYLEPRTVALVCETGSLALFKGNYRKACGDVMMTMVMMKMMMMMASVYIHENSQMRLKASNNSVHHRSTLSAKANPGSTHASRQYGT